VISNTISINVLAGMFAKHMQMHADAVWPPGIPCAEAAAIEKLARGLAQEMAPIQGERFLQMCNLEDVK